MAWPAHHYAQIPTNIALTKPNPSRPTPHEPFIPTKKSTWREKLCGWRGSVVTGALLAFIVFSINFIITMIATTKQRRVHDNRNIMLEGDCSRVKTLNTVAHILINALSTILLGASNYCMQCLSAPTRHEVDQAHASRHWLDIGILSIRNIGKISRKRAMLWWVMGISSLPLHLL